MNIVINKCNHLLFIIFTPTANKMIPVKINIPDIINIIGTDAHAYPLGANIKSRSNLLSGINIAMAMQRTNGSISVRKVFLIHADMPIANVANVTPANKTNAPIKQTYAIVFEAASLG